MKKDEEIEQDSGDEQMPSEKEPSDSDSLYDETTNTDTMSYCSSVMSRKRIYYTDADMKILEQECSSIIRSTKPLNGKELTRLFSTKPLLPLLKKFGFKSLKIKMRTERNKYLDR